VSDETRDQLLTIPEDDKVVDARKSAIIRIHKHDHTMLKIMLKKDRMSFQKFVLFCVRAFLDGDPDMIRMLKSYREMEKVPRDVQDKHMLSHRERTDIFRELEAAQKEST